MAKPKTLSLNQLRKNCAQFVVDWRDCDGDERQDAQSFVADLLKAFGIDRRRAALYEKRVTRATTGNRGYIDALIPGQCVIEMKSAGKDLGSAEEQARDYLHSLTNAEMPQWILTSDFKHFRISDLLSDKVVSFALEDLPSHVEDLQFLAGYQVRKFGDEGQEAASIKAARIMADLYETMEASGYSHDDAGVFMVRILFALYADDAGLWERDLFARFIEERTSEDGSDLGPQLAMLFQVMNKPEDSRQTGNDELLLRFPYVNGDIFAGTIEIAAFDKAMRDELIQACHFNWATISPAIFGSLFQAVKDPKARRELGEHYTTEANILKTINPLFMDGLNGRYKKAEHSIPDLKKLRRDLAKLRFLDPACGCGNFLVVAYRELRALDLRILRKLQELGDTTEIPTLFFAKEHLPVTLDHFAGIEIEDWPARIAATALHLVDHQANQAMELALGKAPEPLPLDKVDTIHIGNSLRMDWEKIFTPSPDVFVMGNPPFIGHKSKSSDQRSDLQFVWSSELDGTLDYVTAWYKKAADYFESSPSGQFAFVSTNSIAQGQSVEPLFRPILDAGWRIFFAHQTFAWVSEAPGGANVHCVIIGFDKYRRSTPRLFTYPGLKEEPVEFPAKLINPYLLDAPVIWVERRSKPLAEIPPASFGSMPLDGGHLLVESDQFDEVMADPVAAKYVRPFKGAKELIHNMPRWCLWLEDLDPDDLRSSVLLRNRITAVRETRLASTRAMTRRLADSPHLFAELRQPTQSYICIPGHFSEMRNYTTVAYFSPEVIAGNANFTATDPDGFLFAVISSSMFMAWQRMVGGALESRLRFSNTIVWNNLPLPAISSDLRWQLTEAGRDVLSARELFPNRSLAEHYNPLVMDEALMKAHRALDKLVDKAFGIRGTSPSTEDRQAALLKSFQAMKDSDSK